jgi:hypothetical protein
MSTPSRSSRWARAQPLTVLVALCLALLAFSATAAAGSSDTTAVISRSTLRAAKIARVAADQTLASISTKLQTCLHRHPRHCDAARRAVKRANGRLTKTERRLASLDANFARRGARVHPSAPVGRPTGSKSESPRIPDGGSGSRGPGGSTTSTGAPTSSPAGATEHTSGGPGSGSGPVESTSPTGPFEMGLVAGSALTYELPFIQKLGAHTARMEYAINTPASQLAPIVEAYARDGIRPLLLATFDGTIPSSAEAQNLGTWAAEFGPNGSLWKGKTFPAGSAVTSIEFGNETSYSYQYSDDSNSGYATRAENYAIRFKEAQAAIQAADPSVGLLAQGDPGNAPGTSWMDNMFKAVPNLGQLVAGWTVHPYGPNWQPIMDKVLSSAKADGAPSNIPLDVTEWGLSTDNGRCLESNYGFNVCMTYQEASATLQSTVAAMRARYGPRLATFYVYQAHDQKASGTSTNREAYFGVLQSDEVSKGAYTTTVESLLSTN